MNLAEELLRQNKQWGGEVFEIGIKRDYLPTLLKSFRTPMIEAVTGVRRAGKSTLLFQLLGATTGKGKIPLKNTLYVNFESPFFTTFNKSAPVLEDIFETFKMLQDPRGRKLVILDEVQNVPHWEAFLRIKYDLDKDTKFYVTGSNSSILSSEFATKLTGRILSHTLYPFSFSEFLRFSGEVFHQESVWSDFFKVNFSKRGRLAHFYEKFANLSGFPEVLKIRNREVSQNYMDNLYRAALIKDVAPRFGVTDTKTLQNLADYLSFNVGALYSYNSLGEALQSNENTIKSYLNYLSQAYLFFELPRYSLKIKRVVKAPRKAYLVDQGFRALRSGKGFDDKAKLCENVVFIELLRRNYKVFYWHNSGEIDFVYFNRKQQLVGLNVCYSNDIPKREFEGFEKFEKEQKIKLFKKIILSQGVFEKKEGVEIVPLYIFLLTP